MNPESAEASIAPLNQHPGEVCYHEPVARGIGRPPPVYLTLNKLSKKIIYLNCVTAA